MKSRILFARRSATALVVLTMSGALVLTAGPVEALGSPAAAVKTARRARLGPVQNLTLGVTKPGAYRVSSHWDALTGAASYQVSLLDSAGTILAKGQVTSPSWAASTTLPALSTVRVRVVPVSSTGRRGTATSGSVELPDLTAPVGTYTVTKSEPDESDVTVKQTSLTDDVSPAANIIRSIDWADDSLGYRPWAAADGDTLAHTYAVDEVYHASIRLEDQAHNVSFVHLTITVNDHVGPTGVFTASPTQPWARFTKVSLGQTSLTDNFSKPGDCTRVVDWNDGSAPVTWATGTPAQHVYATAGTYVPKVHVTDEAGNETVLTASTVTVKADTTAPVVRLRVPRTRVRYVDSWRRLRGTARDDGVGVATVRIKAVEKRAGAWFAYHPKTRTWTKAGLTRRAAMRKAGLVVVRPSSTGTWSYKLSRLRKGRLVLTLTGCDKVGNTSSPKVVRQVLSR